MNPINLTRLYSLNVYAGKQGKLCVVGNRTPAMKLATLLAAAWPGASAKWRNDIRAAIITPEGRAMPTKSIGRVKLKTDSTGKVKLERVHAYDASKQRRIAKSKKVKVKR